MTERSHDAVIIPYRIRKEQEDERRLKALEAEVERLGAENIDPENIHFVMSHPEAVARQMTRDTERIKALEAAVERLGARVTEETRLRNHWRGKAEQFRGKVERLRVAIIEWADSRTRTYGSSSDEEVAQRDADEALLAIDRALAGEGSDDY